jgi:hypothetical protein
MVDTIVKIETYYHLILMQKPMFLSAVDQVYRFEQLHLKQRKSSHPNWPPPDRPCWSAGSMGSQKI